MAKRKADILSNTPSFSGNKKAKHDQETTKSNLLDDSESSISDESEGGAMLQEPQFKINEEYAKRFEHNKKREELHRLEEKFQKTTKPVKGQYGDKYDEDSESSDEEDEDDDGFLVTPKLDASWSAALQAIQSKDPKIYNKETTFFAPIEEDEDDSRQGNQEAKKQKPMYLTDYHRENLLSGHNGAEEDEVAPRTFAQEQDDLKKYIVKEMHKAADDDSGDEGGFLVPKTKPQPSEQNMHPSRAAKVKRNLDVASADKDPNTFLSNFMAARAWVADDGPRFQPFESDDDEEDELADKFEEAYNLRFEDPKGSNEKLKSYARDIIAAKSVRRDEPSGRKKQRDEKRAKAEAEKNEREEDRARLRRLKIEEAEVKLQKIKKAAGLRGKEVTDDDWVKFLDDGWDDRNWEAEMNKRFGEDYYAEQEVDSEEESDAEGVSKKKKKVKKPKWDDDIDIKDLVPEFEEADAEIPAFSLSGSEEEGSEEGQKKSKSSKDRQQEKQAKKKAARLERKRIEDLVDSKMDLDLPSGPKQASLFRYRETSPTSFGLTARDILMATDSSLNQFAGLKKMATFRDAEKKRKDKKNLGKKARLRQWRKETFGNEDGPKIIIGGNNPAGDEVDMGDGVDIVEGGRKKKKRSRKSKDSTKVEA